jgi:hypothetical protein
LSMDKILNKENFSSSSVEGATFGEYKTSSKDEGVQFIHFICSWGTNFY